MNNFAVTSAGLGEALTRSASALDLAGNSIQETAGMVTGIVEVTQDPEKAGSALKILSLRLRGMKGQLEDLGEPIDENVENISKMQGQILNLTKGKVNIFDASGDFKSTYEIMQGIAEVWDELSSTNQADLLETIAGKNRANDVASLLSNWENVEAAVKSAYDAEGSAAKENAKYVDSMQGRLDKLTTAWQSFSNTAMNSDFLKGGISLITGFVDVLDKIIDKVGVLPTLFTAFVGWKSIGNIFNTAKIMQFAGGIRSIGDVVSILSNAFPTLTSLISAFVGILTGATGSVAAFGAALKGLTLGNWIAIAIAAIGIGITLFDKYTESAEELSKRIDEVTSKYKEQYSSLIKLKGDYDATNEDSMISKYGELSKGVNALGENISLTADEYAEYQGIVKQIADTNPSLVTGYNSQGDAILSCAGNVDTLAQSYRDLIKEQNKEVTDTGADIFKDFQNDLKDTSAYYTEVFGETVFDRYDTKHLDQLEKYMNLSGDELESAIAKLSHEEIERLSGLLDEYGIERNLLGSGEKGWETQKEHIIRALGEDKREIKSILDEATSDLNAYAEELGTVAEAYFSTAFLGGDSKIGDYSHFSEKMQSVINQVMSGLGTDFYSQFLDDANPYESLTNYFDSVLSTFDKLSDVDVAKFEAAFDLKTQFNGGDISYGEYVNNIKEAGELIDGLDLDSDVKNQLKLALNTDEITKEYDALVKRLTSKEIGWKDTEAKKFLNSLSAEEFAIAMNIIPELDAGTTINDIRAMIEEEMAAEFKFDITAQIEGIEALNTALEEARSATGLTSESIAALKSRYEDLDGFNAAALFEKTALGIRLNNEELAKLESQYENTNKLNIDSNLNILVTKYKELTEQIKTCTNEQEKEALQSQADTYADKIEELSTLASMYDGLTSAFSKWQQAQSSPNDGDNYDSVYDSLEGIQELYKAGLVGTDDFRTAVQLMSNEDLSTASIDKLVSAYKEGYPKMQKYFTEGQKGCKNFLNDLSKINSEWAHINENGDWEINIDAEEAAKELGTSVDFIYLILNKLKDYGFEINIKDTSVNDLQTKIEQTEAKLKELGQEPVDINVDIEASSENLGTIESEIDKAKSKIAEINNSSADLNVKTAQLEDAQAKLEALIQKKQEASQPAFMSLNTSQVSASLVDALEKVQAYQTALNELNKLNELKEAGITVDDSQITTAQQKIDECAKAIQGLDGNVKLAIGLEEDGSVDSIKKAFEEGKVKIDANTNPAITKIEQLAENVERIEDKDITINVTVNGLEDVKELNRQIDLATNIDGDIDSLSKYVESAKALSELDSNIASYVSANVKGNVTETAEFKLNNIKTFAESAKELKDVGSFTTNVVANLTGNVKDTPEFAINNLKVFSDSAKDLGSIGDVTSSVKANIDGNVIDTPEYMINNLKEYSDSAKDIASIGVIESNVKANIDGNVVNLFEGQIDNLVAYSASAKDVSSIGDVSSTVKANIEGNVTGMLEMSIDNLKKYSESAKNVKDIGEVKSSVDANITGNVTGMLEASIDNLIAYSESAKNVSDIGNVSSSVEANITGNVSGMLEASIDNLAAYSENAKAVNNIGHVSSSVEANIGGNVSGMLEMSIDNLKAYSENAKNVSDIGHITSSVDANITGNVSGMLEMSIDNLKAYTESAKDVSDIGDVSSSVKADIDGNVTSLFEGQINNLKSYSENAKDVESIGNVSSSVTADVDGNVIDTPEGFINNLKVFVDSAKDIESIGEDVKSKVTADVGGNVITTFESSINNLKVFADSAKDIDDIGEDVKAKITADIEGNVINTSKSGIDNLKVFADNAKNVKSVGEDVKAKITADIDGNVKDTPEYMINNLSTFVDSAKDIESIGEDVKAKITADIDGNVKDTAEFAINNLKTFIESAKDIESVGEDVKAKITANIDGNVIWTPEGMINNIKTFADSAKSLNGVGESIDRSVTANIHGNVINTSEEKINNLGVFADNAKKVKGIGNFSSSISANVNGNVTDNDSVVSNLEHFTSVVSGLSGNQNISINVNASVDAVDINTATESLTKVASSGLFKDYNASVTVTTNTPGSDNLTNLKNTLTNLKDKTINVFVRGVEMALGLIGQIKSALNGLTDKDVNINVNGQLPSSSGAASTGTINWINNVTPPTGLKADGTIEWTNEYKIPTGLTGSGTIKWNNDYSIPTGLTTTGTINWQNSGLGPAAGTAHYSGSAFADGTSGHAFARGDWGIKGNGVALGGELGRELVVRNGKFFTIGDKGAEFFRYKKNDIVFNAAQTESLFKYGGIKGANPRGKMLATGSAFVQGNAYAQPITGTGRFWGDNTIYSPLKNSSKSESYSGKSDSDWEKSDNEVFDWIEKLLERFDKAIDSLDKAANNIYKSFDSRNTSLSNEIDKVNEQIANQQKAYERYVAEMNTLGDDIGYKIGSDYENKIRNGDFSIDVLGDEKLIEYIGYYEEWCNKAIEAQEAIEDLKETLSSLYAQRVENVATQYEGILGVIEHEKNVLEEYINQSGTQAWLVSSKYYDALIKNEQETISELENQKAEMLAAFNEAMDSGTIEEGSESYYEMVASIDEVTLAIKESETALLEYEQTIQQLDWEVFDLLQDKISSVADETEFLIELLSNDKLYDDNGKLTNEGKAAMGLHGVAYNTLMTQADQAGIEAEKLKKQLESDPYDTELEERYREMVALQQEYILSAKSEKEAIRDLVEEGIQLELDALDERIEKYKENLDSARDLYEYNKKVKEQSEEIASLEKERLAYQNDDSEEARAKLQEIEVSLKEAEEELAETEMDRMIESSEKLLDNLIIEYEETFNARMDNVDYLVEQMIGEINSDASTISDTITNAASNVGYTLTESMQTIWDKNSVDTKNVITTYGEKFLSAQTTTNAALNNISINLQNMVNDLNKKATANTKSASKSSVAKSSSAKTTTTKKTTTKKSSGGDGTPKIGDRVKYVSGQYYYDSQGKKPLGTHKQGEYVYITNINKKDWATHGYHISIGNKLGKGDLGWLKLNQLSGYATGKKNFLNNEMAWTQEDGKEFIVRPSDGAILTPVAKGDSVLTAAASKNIWDFANSPAEFIKDNLNIGSTSVPNSYNCQNSYTQYLDKVVFNLPNVKNYEQFLSAMQKDKNFERLVQSMTIDQIAGKSSLGKGKSIK